MCAGILEYQDEQSSPHAPPTACALLPPSHILLSLLEVGSHVCICVHTRLCTCACMYVRACAHLSRPLPSPPVQHSVCHTDLSAAPASPQPSLPCRCCSLRAMRPPRSNQEASTSASQMSSTPRSSKWAAPARRPRPATQRFGHRATYACSVAIIPRGQLCTGPWCAGPPCAAWVLQSVGTKQAGLPRQRALQCRVQALLLQLLGAHLGRDLAVCAHGHPVPLQAREDNLRACSSGELRGSQVWQIER